MNGRRSIVGLSLLCALALCAFAASSASAAGTTAFACEPKTGEKGSVGFSDEHCDKAAVDTGVKFVHKAIAPNSPTEIELTNEKTKGETKEAEPSVLTGPLGGIEVLEISCKKVGGTGTLTNEESGAMQAVGNLAIEHSECTAAKPTNGSGIELCKVKSPIVYTANFKTYGNEAEMGLELTPKSGGTFGTFTLENNGANKCPVTGVIGISGSFELTPGGTANGIGATQHFYTGKNNLRWGGNAYSLTGAITLRMKGGNPITFTT